jgi:Rieske Fe-S protein
MERIRTGRRKLLRLIAVWGAALAALPLLWRYLRPKARQGDPVLRVDKAELPGNGALVFARRRIAVIRSGGEVYALSLACTHLGCTVNVTATEMACPCHGSRFDHGGEVLQGPARRPLQRFRVRRENGKFVVLG